MNSTVKYVIKTVFKAISLIIAISILTFVLAELSPIDPVKAYVGAESTVSQEQKDLIAERWGLANIWSACFDGYKKGCGELVCAHVGFVATFRHNRFFCRTFGGSV